MTNTQIAPVPAVERSAAVPVPCRQVPLSALPGVPRSMMAYCPLLTELSTEDLLGQFKAAPQFDKIHPDRLLSHCRGNLEVILLTESDYYARQAAVYLATLRAQTQQFQSCSTEDDYWCDITDLLDQVPAEESPEDALERALTVLSPALLDPSIQSGSEKTEGYAMMSRAKGGGSFQLSKLDSPAVLISAPTGPVLSQQVVEQICSLGDCDRDKPLLDLFIALKPSQVDRELLEELRFKHGFQICQVGQPDRAYLRHVLATEAQSLMLDLSDQVDLDQVVAHTIRYRGSRFEETDLSSLLYWVIQRQTDNRPLTTQDLLFKPYQAEKRSLERLQQLIGLGPVKESLRRLLARSVLEGRRLQAGKPAEPACRNLAFSGPPGTGKSVTARMIAQILREEGVGNGRFVEAGREQLIGPYLGQTSPMVAKLFQQAQGGVLFIDEAGALLDHGRDTYAKEAVNALVRHMELHPETMVIFATYPGEMERFLTSNPGLSSRIAQVLDFKGYDGEQLWEILNVQAKSDGYQLPQQAKDLCLSFFADLRSRKADNFGNGREARRLFQAAVDELALRTLHTADAADALSVSDLEAAAHRLLAQPDCPQERPIGFRVGGNANGI